MISRAESIEPIQTVVTSSRKVSLTAWPASFGGRHEDSGLEQRGDRQPEDRYLAQQDEHVAPVAQEQPAGSGPSARASGAGRGPRTRRRVRARRLVALGVGRRGAALRAMNCCCQSVASRLASAGVDVVVGLGAEELAAPRPASRGSRGCPPASHHDELVAQAEALGRVRDDGDRPRVVAPGRGTATSSSTRAPGRGPWSARRGTAGSAG